MREWSPLPEKWSGTSKVASAAEKRQIRDDDARAKVAISEPKTMTDDDGAPGLSPFHYIS